MDDDEDDNKYEDEDEDGCVEHTEKWIELNEINKNTSFSLDNIPPLNEIVSEGGTKLKKRVKKTKKRVKKTKKRVKKTKKRTQIRRMKIKRKTKRI